MLLETTELRDLKGWNFGSSTSPRVLHLLCIPSRVLVNNMVNIWLLYRYCMVIIWLLYRYYMVIIWLLYNFFPILVVQVITLW